MQVINNHIMTSNYILRSLRFKNKEWWKKPQLLSNLLLQLGLDLYGTWEKSSSIIFRPYMNYFHKICKINCFNTEVRTILDLFSCNSLQESGGTPFKFFVRTSQNFNDESCISGEEGLRGYQGGLFFFYLKRILIYTLISLDS